METPTQARAARRFTGGMIRLALIAFAVLLVASWVWRRVPHRVTAGRMSVTREVLPDAALAPGDLRIYNSDSSVDLVLQGRNVLAGLSPKTVAKIRAEMQKQTDKDSSGLGGMIASTVKQTVASAIGTHVAYPVSDIRAMRYEDGQLVIEHMSGGTTRLFNNTKINGNEAKTFSEADAQRFIEAVRARRNEIPPPPPPP